MTGTKLWYTIVSFGTHFDVRKLCSISDLHSYPPMLYSLAVPSLKRKYCHFLFFFFTFLNFPLAPVQIMKTLPKAQRTCFCIITSYAYSIDAKTAIPFVLKYFWLIWIWYLALKVIKGYIYYAHVASTSMKYLLFALTKGISSIPL